MPFFFCQTDKDKKKVITITPSAIESIGEGVFVLCWCVTLVRLHISPRWCDGPTNQGCPKWSLRWLCTWRIWKVGSEWDNPSGFSSLCWTYPCHQQADIENAETPAVFAQHIGFQQAMHGGLTAEPTICKGSLPAGTHTASAPVTARTAAQGEAGKATPHALWVTSGWLWLSVSCFHSTAPAACARLS